MDETETPQSPAELVVILGALADESVPVQTIAPKFSGRFNKGVDYVGDVSAFLHEFEPTCASPRGLLLPSACPRASSSRSTPEATSSASTRGLGRSSAKRAPVCTSRPQAPLGLRRFVGLAEAGGDGLAIAKEVYRSAFESIDEVVATLRRGGRHRPRQASGARGCGSLGRPSPGCGCPSRQVRPAIQPPHEATCSCGLQGRREDGVALPGGACETRCVGFTQRYGQPVGASLGAAVHGLTDVGKVIVPGARLQRPPLGRGSA